METAGYTFTGTWGWRENIAWQGYTGTLPVIEYIDDIGGNLFGDRDIVGRGHRIALMWDVAREIGIGVQIGQFTHEGVTYNTVMVTENYALSGTSIHLTGVAYEDLDLDEFYTPGEGKGGVTVRAVRVSDQAVYTTTTWDSGGYTLAVPQGTYTVTLSWPGGGDLVYDNVVIDEVNVKLDAVTLPAVDTPDLARASDTGRDDEDNITYMDNGSGARKLTFTVGGTVAGATVTLYADGEEIGSATAGDTTTTIVTDGLHDLADGTHAITARQAGAGGIESPDSAGLAIKVDTAAPAVAAWASAADHGGGERLLNVPDDGAFSEPRDGGINMLVVDFLEEVDLSGATAAFSGAAQGGPVNLTGITAAVTRRDPARVQVRFSSALPDVARYLVRLDGMTDVAGNVLAGDNDRIMTALAGDVNADLATDVFDLIGIWDYRGQAAGAGADQTRADVNRDGLVSASDLAAAWDSRGRDASGLGNPAPPAAPQGAHSSDGLPRGVASLDAAGAAASPSEAPQSGASQPPRAQAQGSQSLGIASGGYAFREDPAQDPEPPDGPPQGLGSLGLRASAVMERGASQLDPDLSSGLTDPLTGDSL